MLLKSGKYDRLNVKIAPCLKSPYACKSTHASIEDITVGSYSEFYGAILFKEATCDGLKYRTYFKIDNNVISYYNHFWGKKVYYSKYEPNKNKLFWFVLDIANDTYRPIEIPELNYLTSKNGSFLVKLKDKFYVLSRELYSAEALNDPSALFYVAIINVNSGESCLWKV